MEITSMLMSKFADVQNICSESPRATMLFYLAGFVYSCVRMLLLSESFEGLSNGAQSLMRSIDLVRAKYPHDDSYGLALPLVDAAQKAATDILFLGQSQTEADPEAYNQQNSKELVPASGSMVDRPHMTPLDSTKK
jgi:hypothetical protein